METAKAAKQVFGFQKSFFDNSFNAMCIVQDQTENMVTGFMNQLPWMTADGKKAVENTMDFTKKIRGDFKKTIDDGYKNFDSFFETK
ncbi:hypothetical protein HRM2_42060 [Desulforapulum autotrophicum HRM2]|uniref:Phasin domain-containing protein n=1 Tax=Desulforapulum autotrophicum (strain ATCC 43914 / DSM 3382 / VKM B-1955 / HRM2) TaxID=177437 RepID=C0QD30_DESAH|nr:hypothetical protein [Desulforapulum autotrophicum]ACN17262.1 hypothetical protein HRM2_42060 [Desulforapulum autotrophicum HRM2]